MDKTSPQAAGLNRRLSTAVITAAAIAVAAITLQAPLPAAAQNQVSLKPRPEAHDDVFKGCFKKDPNGRKWPCSRINNPGVNLTMFDCDIENQMGTEMYLDCDGDQRPYHFGPGERRYFSLDRTSPRVACEWRCAGNVMTGVVVWDEQWPEAWSCRAVGGDGQCRLVFESSKEVVLVTRAGRRVLGDLPIKECSKNWWGYGGWLPFGFGCTYPKHDHKYYGTVKS